MSAALFARQAGLRDTSVAFGILFTVWYAETVTSVSGVLGTVVFGVQTVWTSLLADV